MIGGVNWDRPDYIIWAWVYFIYEAEGPFFSRALPIEDEYKVSNLQVGRIAGTTGCVKFARHEENARTSRLVSGNAVLRYRGQGRNLGHPHVEKC